MAARYLRISLKIGLLLLSLPHYHSALAIEPLKERKNECMQLRNALRRTWELQPPMGVIPTLSQCLMQENMQRFQAKFCCGSHESLLYVIVASTHAHAAHVNNSIHDHSNK